MPAVLPRPPHVRPVTPAAAFWPALRERGGGPGQVHFLRRPGGALPWCIVICFGPAAGPLKIAAGLARLHAHLHTRGLRRGHDFRWEGVSRLALRDRREWVLARLAL